MNLVYTVLMAQIHYRKSSERTIRRVKKGKGFGFINRKGKSVSKATLNRIQKLVIPPAWRDVRISPDPGDYIQAVGVDSRGRKQYIYHPEWVRRSQEHKFDQMITFGERLPTLRATVFGHMREHKLSQDRVIATVIWLLEHTFIRIGNKEYAQENQSYGLTTLREKHVEVAGNTVKFNYRGKSGVSHELDVTHPRVAKTIKACLDLPGYELFQYLGEDGERRIIDSVDVNRYLRAHTGADLSAKDFRTWGGSVLAGDSLYQKGNAETESQIKNNIAEVVAIVSDHLGNTKRICRTYYIHPAVISSYEKEILVPHFARVYGRKSSKKLSLSPEEYATWSLIKDS
ncbi:MAG: topoisomerase protein [Candidatus Woesebacteria bacterium GW2011_GWB1_43_14]|uniref:DNA topoisomerase n=1 Tax=Candidatus Woesebacteria bacterium GW2011_GWB1_43_14 TaxID=1618578 RepID=A0A0G1GJI3_9BACT|nr:MAG: topoisomerase protein [Candidatus Woesebacteria bacterium GW2011_GWC1_42_9]KKS98938.1 MAG: topoisomerase protein [Candidatus Woesebacteria bacterium GW2011_GWB1_43_14]